jgi:hypothetical protein
MTSCGHFIPTSILCAPFLANGSDNFKTVTREFVKHWRKGFGLVGGKCCPHSLP